LTSGPDTGRYDPFEDTGDWPFRDAPPRQDERAPADEISEVEHRSVVEDTELDVAIEAEETPPVSESTYDELPAALEMHSDADPLPELEPDPAEVEPEPEPELEPSPMLAATPVVEEIAEAEIVVEEEPEDGQEEAQEEAQEVLPAAPVEHAPGTLTIPPGVDVLAGGPHGFRRNVAVVVSRFNGDITTGLLESALAALRDCNVAEDAITVVPVPGAFELPLSALALAKTRRFSCVVALGCIIRGETPHFDLIASEAASGLQLAAIETGIPVAFGVITAETREQAEQRLERGDEAARTALEMADLFSHVRTRAAAT
jgi:6,7-dimethyl-8-ribityllumazine synthase